MYDDYINSTGYINESRVKLLTMDTTGNPYGVLDIFKTANTDSKIVVEDYYMVHKDLKEFLKLQQQ